MTYYAKLTYPELGDHYDKENIKTLDENTYYEINYVVYSRYGRSYIELENINGCFFADQFEFYDKNYKVINIQDINFE